MEVAAFQGWMELFACSGTLQKMPFCSLTIRKNNTLIFLCQVLYIDTSKYVQTTEASLISSSSFLHSKKTNFVVFVARDELNKADPFVI